MSLICRSSYSPLSFHMKPFLKVTLGGTNHIFPSHTSLEDENLTVCIVRILEWYDERTVRMNLFWLCVLSRVIVFQRFNSCLIDFTRFYQWFWSPSFRRSRSHQIKWLFEYAYNFVTDPKWKYSKWRYKLVCVACQDSRRGSQATTEPHGCFFTHVLGPFGGVM